VNRSAFYALSLLTAAGFTTISATAAPPAPKSEVAEDSVSTLTGDSDANHRPWAVGIALDRQRQAQLLLDQGNAQLRESFFTEAISKYRESLALWDHPSAHYNLALALLTQDDPIETLEHFQKAIAFGSYPLGEDKFTNAQKYIALLDKQVAHVDISCNEPGATIRLDGKLLFEAPGRFEGLVLRGEHSISATKPDYEKTELNPQLEPGTPYIVNLQLYRPDELYVYSYKYPRWIPITVTAAGLLVAGGGGAATYLSQREFDRFDSAISSASDCATGCQPSDKVQAHYDRGELYRTLSYIGYATGGALVATGITLWVLDTKESRRLTPAERQKLSFLPVFGPQTLGFGAWGHF
jgi:tetratricopeptide (TPR) repeat protein